MSKSIHDQPLRYDATYGHEMQIRIHAEGGIDASEYIPIAKGLMIDLVNEARFNSIDHIERVHDLSDGSKVRVRQSYGVQVIDIYPADSESYRSTLLPAFICCPRSMTDAPYGWIREGGEWVPASSETPRALFVAYRNTDDDGNLIGYRLSPMPNTGETGGYQPYYRAGGLFWVSAGGNELISWGTSTHGPGGEPDGFIDIGGSTRAGEIYRNGGVIAIAPITFNSYDYSLLRSPVLGACLREEGDDIYLIFSCQRKALETWPEPDPSYPEFGVDYQFDYYSIYAKKLDLSQPGGGDEDLILLASYDRHPETWDDFDGFDEEFYVRGRQEMTFSSDGRKAFMAAIKDETDYFDGTGWLTWDRMQQHEWDLTNMFSPTYEMTQVLDTTKVLVTKNESIYHNGSNNIRERIYTTTMENPSVSHPFLAYMERDGDVVTEEVVFPLVSGTSYSAVWADRPLTSFDTYIEYNYRWGSGYGGDVSVSLFDQYPTAVGASVRDWVDPVQNSGGSSSMIDDEVTILQNKVYGLSAKMIVTGSKTDRSSSYRYENFPYGGAQHTPDGELVYEKDEYGSGSTDRHYVAALHFLSTGPNDTESTTHERYLELGTFSYHNMDNWDTSYKIYEHGQDLYPNISQIINGYSVSYGLAWATSSQTWDPVVTTTILDIGYFESPDTSFEQMEFFNVPDDGRFDTTHTAPGVSGAHLYLDQHLICSALVGQCKDQDGVVQTEYQTITFFMGREDFNLLDTGNAPVLTPEDAILGHIFPISSIAV